jgi:hypothetical protein
MERRKNDNANLNLSDEIFLGSLRWSLKSLEAEFGGSLNGKSRYITANNKSESVSLIKYYVVVEVVVVI